MPVEEMVVEPDKAQEPETPSVHTMTREQLDGLMKDAPETPTAPVQEAPKEDTPTPDTVGDGKDATATEPVVPTPAVDNVEALKKENEKLKKRAEHQEKFFARQATEIGLLRQRTPAEDAAELQQIREAYMDDPVRGKELHDAYTERKRQESEAIQRQNFESQARASFDTVQGIAPDFADHLDDIVGLMKEDGAQEQTVSQFLQMPYAMPPATLVNLYQRVRLNKELSTYKTENEALKKEIETLKSKPATILENIEKAASRKTITASAAGASAQAHDSVPNKPVHMMSRDELQKLRETQGG